MEKKRDAEGTRRRILDVAETLFAAHGYDGVGVGKIAQAAGVSRATPSYFFGSKEGLYDAVLERLLNADLDEFERAVAGGEDSAGRLAAALEAHIDFIAAHPSFLLLLTRETLAGRPVFGRLAALSRSLEGAVRLIEEAQAQGVVRNGDPRMLLMNALGLCWAPFIHGRGAFADFGYDVAAPSFVEAHKRNVVEMFLRGAGGDPLP